MANLKTLPAEITAGRYAGQHTPIARAIGLAAMAESVVDEALHPQESTEMRDALSGVLAFVAGLAHSYTLDLEDLLDHALEMVQGVESKLIDEPADVESEQTTEEATV